MIKFYYSGAPNPMKVALMLEETGLPYEAIPVDTRKGEQHKPEYLAINPNAKVPAIVDGDATVFDSNAILLYLAEKTGKFLPAKSDKARGELLSWLMFVASGVGPFSGQSVHFRHYAPEKNPLRHQPLHVRGAAPLRHPRRRASASTNTWSATLTASSTWRCGAGRGSSRPCSARSTGRSSPTSSAWSTRSRRGRRRRAPSRIKDKHKFKTEFDEEARKAMFRHMDVKVA